MMVNFDSGLLELIVMVQRYKALKVSEKLFNEQFGLPGADIDWYAETKKYFNSIDSEVLKKYDLSKNNLSFEIVINFLITDEMLSVDSEKLDQFVIKNY